MHYRYLGNTGLRVSEVSLGGWITFGKELNSELTSACIAEAYQNRINFFDTAEVYANGNCEKDMGIALRRLNVDRSNLVISTKLFWGGDTVNARGLSRKHIREGLKNSLERLGLEYVDVVYAHRPDEFTPIEETVRAFNWCIDHGMALYWGTSEWSSQQITEAQKVAEHLGLIGPCVEQPQYNMFHRERVEKEYLPLYRSSGLGLTTYSPLASGMLTGKYNIKEQIPQGSRFEIKGDAIIERVKQHYLEGESGRMYSEKVKALGPIARQIGCSMAQLAIAWCLKNAKVSSVITGASRKEQISENVKAVSVIDKMTPTIMLDIDSILGNRPDPEPNWRM